MLRAASVVALAAASLSGSRSKHHRSLTASGYTHLPAACVHGNNIELHKRKTVAECAAICDANPSCLAFEYGVEYGGSNGNYEAGDCQEQSSAEVTDCSGTYYNLDLYVKGQTPDAPIQFQEGLCYPVCGAPSLSNVGSMEVRYSDGTFGWIRPTPQSCYNYCKTYTQGYPDRTSVAVHLNPEADGGGDPPFCWCKNDYIACKRHAGTAIAIANISWSWMTGSYFCFVETFDADAEFCDDDCGKDDSEDNSLPLAVILGIVGGAVFLVGIAVCAYSWKRQKSTKPPSSGPPPQSAPPPPPIIKATASEELVPPSTALAEEAPAAEGWAAATMAERPAGADVGQMYHRMKGWYNEAPESAALRTTWGAYPTTPRALEAWSGFVTVTNAFLDHAGPPVAPAAASAHPPEPEFEPEC
jgi:hypothetical protein